MNAGRRVEKLERRNPSIDPDAEHPIRFISFGDQIASYAIIAGYGRAFGEDDELKRGSGEQEDAFVERVHQIRDDWIANGKVRS